jgi:F0F1-type ATP synthase membrane subunit b/b'
MRIFMSEKQASSEIAEQELQRVCEGIESNWPMRGWQIADQIRPLLREAERDTRERVAQLARDIAKEVGGKFAETHSLNVGLNKFIKELERIRGKE